MGGDTVVLFGAAGFVGRAMLPALMDAGFRVRALDLSPASWTATDAHGRKRIESGLPIYSHRDDQLELVYGDISDPAVVAQAMEGCTAVVHTTVFFPQQAPGDNSEGLPDEVADKTWLVNLKGLHNVLEVASRTPSIRRVVHIGSCPTAYPGSTGIEKGSVKMTQDVRRPDGSMYAVQKRLQEEMTRQFYEAHGVRTVTLRPDGIMDLRSRSNRGSDALGDYRLGWICRHQLAECAIAAIRNDTHDFGIFHTATIPSPPVTDGQPNPREVCNVGETEAVLGVSLEADVRQPTAKL